MPAQWYAFSSDLNCAVKSNSSDSKKCSFMLEKSRYRQKGI